MKCKSLILLTTDLKTVFTLKLVLVLKRHDAYIFEVLIHANEILI